jgi:hypothetical protein
MIKPMKIGLRIWLAITAAVSFLTGWAMLAHSAKPVSASAATSSTTGSTAGPLSLPTLAPVPGLSTFTSGGSQTTQNLQPLQIQPSSPFASSPALRTRGS